MKLTVFFKLQLKRMMKNIPMMLLLLIFPLCLFLLSRSFDSKEDSRIAVGLCLATEDTLAGTVCEKLVNGNDSLFSFSMFIFTGGLSCRHFFCQWFALPPVCFVCGLLCLWFALFVVCFVCGLLCLWFALFAVFFLCRLLCL